LFGLVQDTDHTDQHDSSFPSLGDASKLVPFLLSRRARGKAFDRLIIDYSHGHRQHVAEYTDKAAKRASSQALQSRISRFCECIVRDSSQKSSMGFSSIRTLARRLKQPLSKTLSHAFCFEGCQLGLRFENIDDKINVENKYSDWTPIIDCTIANSLENDDDNAGTRCAFVGFEDETEGGLATASLNVEQLAMEYYKSGRLPSENDDATYYKGGWSGFHDEGESSLFSRTLCLCVHR
jgi:hypothetical protein